MALVLAKLTLDDSTKALVNPDDVSYLVPVSEPREGSPTLTRIVLRNAKALTVKGGIEGIAQALIATISGRWE